MAATLNNFGSYEDISGFTGDLSSSESIVSGPDFQTVVGGEILDQAITAKKDNDDDEEPSSGPDGFNEVGEVFVRFKPLACRPGLLNEAFDDSDSFVGTLTDSEDEKAFENLYPKSSFKVHSEHRIRLWVPQAPALTESVRSGFLKRLGPISLPRVDFPTTSTDYWTRTKAHTLEPQLSASVQSVMNRGEAQADPLSQNRNSNGNNNNNNVSSSNNNNFVTLIPIDYSTNGRASVNRSQYHQRHSTGDGGLRTASVSSVSSSSSILSSGRTAAYGNASVGHHRKKNKLRHIQDDMDPDYRDYFNRPRGEFLTRGAALASQQSVVQEYGQALGTPVGSTRGSLSSHLDSTGMSSSSAVYSVTQRSVLSSSNAGNVPSQLAVADAQAHEQLDREPRRYVGPHELARTRSDGTSTVGRLQAAGSKEKLGTDRRNPTILRKKLDVCIYLMSAIGIKMEVEEGASATASELAATLLEEEELGVARQVGMEVFSLWMTSPLLEVQLKPHHKPFYIRREWNHFLQRFSSAPLEKKTCDEPILSLQRNVFFHKRDEVKIREHKILELLYEEAKYNILTGRYPCEISDYIMLGGIQARLELGPYDIGIHTPSYMRTVLFRFLPEHATWSSNWSSCMSWRGGGAKNSPESRLIEQFKAIPSNASPKRLVRKYLEFCWSLPYYGSAFFHGQIETPSRTLTSLFINHDTEVAIAINAQGLYVIDPVNVVILLGLKLEELSWDYAKPSQENNDDCLPCLFIQFCVIENGRRVSKILQIFSRQAVQMDALIATFVDELKQRVAMYNEDPDGNLFNDVSSTEADDCLVPLTTVSRRGIPESCLSNKLNRLTLATFDDEGHCIGHMGSWSFSN